MEEVVMMEKPKTANQSARDALKQWQDEINENVYSIDEDYIHTIQFSFPDDFKRINQELENFGFNVAHQLEPLVSANNMASNLPQLEEYNSIGERVDKITHHPTYVEAGDIIYSSRLLEKMAQPGGLTECLSLLFLSSQTGEAGHNCPIACSAGIIRVLQKVPNFPEKETYLEKLITPSYQTNFTGAQFLTEIQGGSDVGQNAVYAKQNEDKVWQIYGEKWFCSNAGANLIFITARYDANSNGTKGLGLFLIPAEWKGRKNNYKVRRLKDKIGTRSMATGEIDFNGAYAIQIGSLSDGFHLVMDNVLHLSRLFNSFCVLGMARRAYSIARSYAKHRIAFAHEIIHYPLVKENLAKIKAENTAMIAAMFATARIQDSLDANPNQDERVKLLLRVLVNMQKYLTALYSVHHIHHAIDVLAGNGTIETFSPLPRLLRDCIVCENWEGTHNILRAQIYKDILKYDIDKIYLAFLQDELKKLDEKLPQAQEVSVEIKKLESELNKFRQLNNELQSLEIKNIVDRMAMLYCGIKLLIEAQHQVKFNNSFSKMDCYHYFYMLHLSKNPIVYDDNYLDLMSRIIA